MNNAENKAELNIIICTQNMDFHLKPVPCALSSYYGSYIHSKTMTTWV
jgi:hypothetical protein